MEQPTRDVPADPAAPTRPPVVRTLVAGVLMGLANLVPGVSGGTMVLVMGLYNRFIAAVADVSRGRFSWPATTFLALLIVGAGGAIVALAGVMTHLVTTHRAVMYALFIGMTLGGVPVLWRMCRPIDWRAGLAFAIGLGGMLLLAFTEDEGAKEAAQALREAEAFRPVPAVVRDLLGGALSMAAMVLPGISGAYMLLLLGRYEHVTGSVSALKDAAGGDTEHLSAALWVLGPIAAGSVLALVLLSNLLKYLLARHERAMGGLLLGVLIGSAAAIYPFNSRDPRRRTRLRGRRRRLRHRPGGGPGPVAAAEARGRLVEAAEHAVGVGGVREVGEVHVGDAQVALDPHHLRRHRAERPARLLRRRSITASVRSGSVIVRASAANSDGRALDLRQRRHLARRQAVVGRVVDEPHVRRDGPAAGHQREHLRRHVGPAGQIGRL